MNRRRLQPVANLLLLISLVLAGGCRALKPVTSAVVPGKQNASKLSEPELRDKLGMFYVQFASTVETATARAAAQSADERQREELLAARLRMVRSCREIIFQRRPMAAFVDTWSFCVQLGAYLETPAAQSRWGTARPHLLEAVHQLDQELEGMGRFFMKTNELASVRGRLESFARDNPFQAQGNMALPSTDAKVGIPELGWLLNIPLSPFRAFEGVDHTAQAVQEFTAVAADIGQTVRDLPRELSWGTELLLLQTRRELTGLVADLDAKQTNTQATLAQVRGALTDASNVVARLDPTMAGVERTLKAAADASGAIDATLKTYTQMMKDLYPPKTDAEKAREAAEPKGRPFDILDYAKTAEGVTAAASELKQILVELQKTVATNAVSLRLKEIEGAAESAIAKTEASTRELANHLAWRAVLVIAAFFAGLLLYRVAVAMILRKRQGPASGGA